MSDRPRLKSPLDSDSATNASPPSGPKVSVPARPRLQISMRMLFVVTLIVAIGSAAFGGMQRGGENRMFYVLFGMAAPVVVMVVVGVFHQIARRRGR